jgi:hypothetical protein
LLGRRTASGAATWGQTLATGFHEKAGRCQGKGDYSFI